MARRSPSLQPLPNSNLGATAPPLCTPPWSPAPRRRCFRPGHLLLWSLIAVSDCSRLAQNAMQRGLGRTVRTLERVRFRSRRLLFQSVFSAYSIHQIDHPLIHLLDDCPIPIHGKAVKNTRGVSGHFMTTPRGLVMIFTRSRSGAHFHRTTPRGPAPSCRRGLRRPKCLQTVTEPVLSPDHHTDGLSTSHPSHHVSSRDGCALSIVKDDL